MENTKTVSDLNNKAWYRAVKVIYFALFFLGLIALEIWVFNSGKHFTPLSNPMTDLCSMMGQNPFCIGSWSFSYADFIKFFIIDNILFIAIFEGLRRGFYYIVLGHQPKIRRNKKFIYLLLFILITGFCFGTFYPLVTKTESNNIPPQNSQSSNNPPKHIDLSQAIPVTPSIPTKKNSIVETNANVQNNSSSSNNTNSNPSPTIPTPPILQQPPQQTWHTVLTYNNSQVNVQNQTQNFNIQGQTWRIKYSCLNNPNTTNTASPYSIQLTASVLHNPTPSWFSSMIGGYNTCPTDTYDVVTPSDIYGVVLPPSEYYLQVYVPAIQVGGFMGTFTPSVNYQVEVDDFY